MKSALEIAGDFLASDIDSAFDHLDGSHIVILAEAVVKLEDDLKSIDNLNKILAQGISDYRALISRQSQALKEVCNIIRSGEIIEMISIGPCTCLEGGQCESCARIQCEWLAKYGEKE